jgi:hypothetical protein
LETCATSELTDFANGPGLEGRTDLIHSHASLLS